MAKKTNDDSSLSHTRWNCKYHIVFIPKYRRKEIYGKLRANIGQIIRQLCEYKDVEIIEAHAMSDHIHMLVKIPPKLAVSIDNGIVNDKGIPVTEEREYRPLESIKDNYPKYVLTLDTLLQQRNGIKHENIIKFLLDKKMF